MNPIKKLIYLLSTYFILISPQTGFSSNFIENKTQWNAEVIAKSNANAFNLWIKHNGVRADMVQKVQSKSTDSKEMHLSKFKGHVWDMEFANSLSVGAIDKQMALGTNFNYFFGKESSLWSTNCKNYESVQVNHIYPGIHVKHYFNKNDQYEFDFILEADASVEDIQLQFKGLVSSKIKDDALELGTSIGEVYSYIPKAYYLENGDQCIVEAIFYTIDSTTFGFKLLDEVPTDVTLVIDPILEYSTYVTCGMCDDYAYSVQLDLQNNIYFSGVVFHNDYPKTVGAYDTSYNKGGDTYITKLNPAGSSILYSTFVGGDSLEVSNAIRVNGNGEAYSCGYTLSQNFPTTAGAYETTYNNDWDSYVYKLSANGDSLIYSTLIGGSGNDRTYSMEIYNDRAHVVGATRSADYPVTGNALYGTINTGFDAMLTILSTQGNALLYSTFIGGSASDFAYAIDIDNAGNVYVGGHTRSNNFPTTLGAFDVTHSSNNDCFLLKYNVSSNSLDYSTYMGGTDNELLYSVEVNSAGELYFGGSTASADFPVSPTAFTNTFTGFPGFYMMLIGKLDATGTNQTSTFLGGANPDEAYGITLGSSEEEVIITGETASFNFPLTNDAVQTVNRAFDFVLAVMDKDFTTLKYSTLLGGSFNDYNKWAEPELANDSILVITGTAHSADFPTTINAFQPTKIDSHTNDAVVLMKWNLAPFLTPDSTIVLPVSFKEFVATLYGNDVIVKWITASEYNNDRFEIERSINGQDWNKIGIVKGAGNTNQAVEYNFADQHPAQGINYYRLKQVDANGDFDYSAVKSITYETNPNIDVTIINNKLMVNFDSVLDAGRLQIHGLNGQLLYQTAVANTLTQVIDINEFAQGIYLVSVSSDQLLYKDKFYFFSD